MNHSTDAITSDITAVILAGGASHRMNQQPKALLTWRGQRFIDHIVAQLRDQAATIAISSNQAELFTSLQLPVLPDPFPERRGPLAGMLADCVSAQPPLLCSRPAIRHRSHRNWVHACIRH